MLGVPMPLDNMCGTSRQSKLQFFIVSLETLHRSLSARAMCVGVEASNIFFFFLLFSSHSLEIRTSYGKIQSYPLIY
jgi:hypothetical protein